MPVVEECLVMPSKGGKRVWVLGKLEEDLRILWCACFCREGVMTCPNPFLVLRGSRTFPVSRTPHLLVPTKLDAEEVSKSCK